MRFAGAPNFRPKFRYFNRVTALSGFVLSLIVMFVIDSTLVRGNQNRNRPGLRREHDSRPPRLPAARARSCPAASPLRAARESLPARLRACVPVCLLA